MINSLLAKKQNMGQVFIQDTRVPVTYVTAGPCVVTQVKTKDNDGYDAVQIGFGSKDLKKTSKPLQGHLKATVKDKKAPRHLKEIRLDKPTNLKVGDVISISDVFKKGDLVSVTSTSKGKGFQGVVKRWGFAGGPRTHGQSDRQRAPGSIGQGTNPGRVRKGKKMAGRMGQDRVTIKNLIITSVDEKQNLLTLSGPVPGSPGTLMVINKIGSGKLDTLVEEAPEIVVQEEVTQEAEGEDKSQQPQTTQDEQKPSETETKKE